MELYTNELGVERDEKDREYLTAFISLDWEADEYSLIMQCYLSNDWIPIDVHWKDKIIRSEWKVTEGSCSGIGFKFYVRTYKNNATFL